ncbi:PhzF family phenazine biosynthesis protein [Cognatishimia sp. WU-CL00825]|uniref:PhzF family phenazine biosynthesis protein n=1 Tax=Cognatishimia sp. WU-CL00825 TaxID=3127658 RepID=UPI003109C4A8
MTDFFVYDVFSAKAFGGNQLAIVPDATALPEDDLQRIAREFNYSESTFVFPPAIPGHRAKVRIFTPTMEIPFAGHPVIGTAVALADIGPAGDMILELGVGPLACHAAQGQARFTTEVPLTIIAEPTLDEVSAALGLKSSDIKTDIQPPILASVGLPFTITELHSRAALANIQLDVAKFRAGAQKYPNSLDFAQFSYVKNGDTVHARMFAPLDNIYEDPATGSACAALGALLQHLGKTDLHLTIHQGEDMGRHSIIDLKTNGPAITISGAAKRVMQGQLVY